MGALTSRQNAGVEEVDIVSNHAYKYPPKSGNYFGSHFIMGGERFDTPQPEAYLFGENADLNFLGNRPTPFPYPPPQANEPTKTLKSLVNIRKESLRLVKAVGWAGKGEAGDGDVLKPAAAPFNIEFTFDCDARTAITIYYFATEEFTPNGVVYTPRDSSTNSETYHYKRGANQQFCQPMHVFDPSRYTDEELMFNPDKDVLPIVIHCVALDGSEETRQSHTSVAVVERHSDGAYVMKALKQKLFVDGLCYLLQEIYGIENKSNEMTKAQQQQSAADDELEDNGSECVICMCETRDTLILPCRHLCLCNSCADSLRYQANNCPICRAPFRALLQIRALQKTYAPPAPTPATQLPPATEGSCENIPAGYSAVSLIEALNGPSTRPMTVTLPVLSTSDTPDDTAVQAAEILNRSSLERTPKSVKLIGSPTDYDGDGSCTTPELRMSVLLAREGSKEKAKSPLLTARRREKGTLRPRDTIRLVNETVQRQHDEREELDEATDSEAEKMSPLLDVAASGDPAPEMELQRLSIQMAAKAASPPTPPVTVSQVNPRELLGGGALIGTGAAGEDSDYYTPEDPATTILSPLHTEKEREGSGARWTALGVGLSLPGTPLSTASHRSSGDSYSSSGSTRLLLSVTHNDNSTART